MRRLSLAFNILDCIYFFADGSSIELYNFDKARNLEL